MRNSQLEEKEKQLEQGAEREGAVKKELADEHAQHTAVRGKYHAAVAIYTEALHVDPLADVVNTVL